MPEIHLLPDLLINQIAAGEVVERPASALKELLENSVDAGATEIEVRLTQGGIKQIQVTDNGGGIPGTELALALERHTTSKIASLEDLERVASLGFRGEALASIASVSRIALTSRTRDAEHAWQVQTEGGALSTPQPAAHPGGTTIEARDLYFNTPARRKFLKTEATEYAHCDEMFKRIALAHPEVGFTLQHNGRVAWHLRPSTLAQRVHAILGEDFSQASLPIDVDAAGLRLSGFAGVPAYSRASRIDINRQRCLRKILAQNSVHPLRQGAGTQMPGHAAIVLQRKADLGMRQGNAFEHFIAVRVLGGFGLEKFAPRRGVEI